VDLTPEKVMQIKVLLEKVRLQLTLSMGWTWHLLACSWGLLRRCKTVFAVSIILRLLINSFGILHNLYTWKYLFYISGTSSSEIPLFHLFGLLLIRNEQHLECWCS
jgi:hypothetical protein